MVAALIIAAGKTRRRVRFDPLKKVGTITAIQRIVMVFKRAGIERIVVVCDGDKTENLASRMNVIYLYNGKNAEMFDNVKMGLTYLQGKCSAALITHTDVPLFSVETVRRLMDAEGAVRIPSYHGSTGHPMLLKAEHFKDILCYNGDGGLSKAVKHIDAKCCFVEVKDEGIIAGLKTGEDYEHLLINHDLTRLQLDIRLRLTKEKPFFGPGAYQLLELIEETNSLRRACLRMGISYSKGRSIVSLLNQQLGYPVIESRQGGKSGGYSVITEEGKELMRTYTDFCTEAKQHLQSLFDKYFNPR